MAATSHIAHAHAGKKIVLIRKIILTLIPIDSENDAFTTLTSSPLLPVPKLDYRYETRRRGRGITVNLLLRTRLLMLSLELIMKVPVSLQPDDIQT